MSRRSWDQLPINFRDRDEGSIVHLRSLDLLERFDSSYEDVSIKERSG